MPKKGLPQCDCDAVDRDYWLVKENKQYCWMQCRHCGETRKSWAFAPRLLELRPKNWQELLTGRKIMAEPKNIWDLELHENLVLEQEEGGGLGCMRVPGGWLYTMIAEGRVCETFVPYAEDLKPKPEEKLDDPLDIPRSPG